MSSHNWERAKGRGAGKGEAGREEEGCLAKRKSQSRFLVSRDDIIYTGMDIVPALIEKHKKTFLNTAHTFINANIVKVSILVLK